MKTQSLANKQAYFCRRVLALAMFAAAVVLDAPRRVVVGFFSRVDRESGRR